MQSPQHLSAKRLLRALVAVIVVFLLLVSVINVAQKYFTIRAHNRDLIAQKNELQEKQLALKTTNEYLDSPAGKEQALRDKFNVVKPGEGIVIVTTADTDTLDGTDRSAVSRWWDAVLRGLGIR